MKTSETITAAAFLGVLLLSTRSAAANTAVMTAGWLQAEFQVMGSTKDQQRPESISRKLINKQRPINKQNLALKTSRASKLT